MYELTGVLGRAELLRDRVAGLPETVVVELNQGLGLVPVGEELFRELTGARRVDFAELPETFAALLAEWSQAGPIAFVEAEFFAGDGYQGASVWRDGLLEWGPVVEETCGAARPDWPINTALTRLGAVSDGRDLFSSVGLGAERDVADWLARGRLRRRSR
ncbi:hypothetical protein N8J89_33700 [Crossiella sp. CA-258035]|uniref:hypothetical protein n=1 Tax=Crossiella sp. CA-258035 TaxID=2981138 RepID=UPI0024BC587E|nr:hypothetical protein [Crossiella sp. CA-258035]WHT18031.1 hypothetical protein N8J89_33700 [Crossiella sp. CA-258035]